LKKDLDSDLQLSFYALAATEVRDEILGKKPEEIILSLFYLDKDTKLTTTRTAQQLQEEKGLILKKAKEISESKFTCSKSLFCKRCEYKMLCKTSS